MTEEELRMTAMGKIEKALSMELPAEVTAMYILAFAQLVAGGKTEKAEGVKV